MEQKKPISNIAAGLIIGGILTLLSSISLYVSNDEISSATRWLDWIIIIGGLILFINLYAKSLDNEVKFGNLFSYGFKITAIFTLVVVASVIIFNVISPELKDKGFELARTEMENDNRMKDEEIEKYLGWMKDYFWAIAIGSAILGNLFAGCIGSLIGAAVTKKNPRNPMQQIDQLDS